jgi:hypothetical protein
MANKAFQILTVLPALTSPVTITQSKTLEADMAALGACSVPYLKAITIVCLAFELNGYTGTNYVSPVNMKQLDQDATSLFGGVELLAIEANLQYMTIVAALAWNAAAAKVGATFTATYSDVNALLAFAPGLLELPDDRLNQMIFLLRYRLSVLSV